MMHKKLSVLMIALLFFSFSKPKKILKQLNATQLEWVSGHPSGGSGTTYHLEFKAVADKIFFKRLWLGQNKFNYTLNNDEDYEKITLRKDSVATIEFTVKGQFNHSDTLIGRITPPVQYQGAALLEVAQGGRLHYIVVKEFKVLPKVKGI